MVTRRGRIAADSQSAAAHTGIAPVPSELTSIARRYLPYATGAADAVAYWDVSTKSNKPHCLIVGPTGGGKTSAIRTILTEASLRGIPFIGVDPKMIELDGLEGTPAAARSSTTRSGQRSSSARCTPK
ncbi:hypothetical protein GCM10020255_008460 [Rhodococcus baikonurensis]